jgi:hypothetical protein
LPCRGGMVTSSRRSLPTATSTSKRSSFARCLADLHARRVAHQASAAGERAAGCQPFDQSPGQIAGLRIGEQSIKEFTAAFSFVVSEECRAGLSFDPHGRFEPANQQRDRDLVDVESDEPPNDELLNRFGFLQMPVRHLVERGLISGRLGAWFS